MTPMPRGVAEPMAVFEDRIGRLARDVVDALER